MIKNSITNKYYVYGHYRNDTNTLFYVGKGCNDRAWSKSGRNQLWKRIVEKHGYSVFIFYNDLLECQAFKSEKDLILDLNPIANFSNGGVGGNTLINKTQKEIEIINNKKSKKVSGKNHPQYGVKKSPKTIEKIKQSLYKTSTIVICNETGEMFRSMSECAKKLNINVSNLSRIKHGKRKSLKGLTFKFIEPATDPTAWSAQYSQKLDY